MKILYIDDERDILVMISRFLELLGHTVVVAESGLEGWELFAREPDSFDVLITDERMPQMSGLELIRQLRSQGHLVPVIIASGHINEEFEEQAAGFGVRSILSKPYSLADFRAVLDSIEG